MTHHEHKGIRKQRLGEWLVDLNLISRRQLEQAMELQSNTGARLGDILVQLGYLSERELSDVLIVQDKLASHAALTDFPIDVNVLRLLNVNFVKQHLALPLLLVGNRLVIAHNQKDNVQVLDRVSLLTGYKILSLAFRTEDIQHAIPYFYESKTLQNAGAIERAIKGASDANAEGAEQPILPEDGPIVELFNSILHEAIESQASDIHIENHERCLIIRMRTDGALVRSMEIPKSLATSLVARVKVLADMNITETRRPQDGRFSIRVGRATIDFRVSSVSSHWGESVVIRVLRPLDMVGGMETLGFGATDLVTYKRILSATGGMILVTGPTGSGKTSTLYSSVGMLDRVTSSVYTIEDPVEFPLDGTVQIQVQAKIGLTFAAALRSILRQDPDVIMLGEIRDSETLEAAIAAALTGHLVLSTLHANDSIATVSRMMDMGAKSYLISSTLVGVLAQRLVRRICPKCAADHMPSAEELEFLKLPEGSPPPMLSKGRGCTYCKGTGYKGRIGIFEILRVNRQIRDLINNNASSTMLYEAAKTMGFRPLIEDARQKVLEKMTTCQEVLRVLGLGSED